MTQDEIIEMAKTVRSSGYWDSFDLINFAKLVAAKEREACAKLCHEIYNAWVSTDDDSDYPDALDCIRAIRARGEA